MFAKGDIASPEITRIIQFEVTNETELNEEREYIYALERNGVRTKAHDVFKIYTFANARSTLSRSRTSKSNAQYNNRLDAKRSRSEIKANPIVEFHVNGEGNTITYTYSNGETFTSPRGKASRELDTAYLPAVENGDTETAQRMVDEAFQKRGHPMDYKLVKCRMR